MNAEEILSSYRKEAKSLIDKILENKNEQGILYHYTDDAGLRGIIESGKLWLTDIFNLNDPSELQHGSSIAARLWNAEAKKNNSHSIDCFARRFHFGCENDLKRAADIFTCSFSMDGDNLSLWRAYGDDGRGYALGFDAEALVNAFKGSTPATESLSFPVTYDDSKLESVQQEIIELSIRHMSLLDQIDGDSAENDMINLFESVGTHAIWAAMFFKHKAYENELEFRLLQEFETNTHDAKLRYGHYEVIKYREFDWRIKRERVLKRIVIGPSADKQKASRFVEDCLAHFHSSKDDVEIVYSTIPYRSTTSKN